MDDSALEELVDRWASEYASRWPGAELLAIDIDGYHYLFDYAERDEVEQESRVVAAWGRSRPPTTVRDRSRMRGHPRPGRDEDDRGHLLAHAGGAGYDINPIPQDSALNRGTSDQGREFRAMERYWASHPGTFMYLRPLYDDERGRPGSFEVGIETTEGLQVNRFDN